MVYDRSSHGHAERFALDRRSYLRTLGAAGSGLALGGFGGTTLGTSRAKAATSTIEDFERTNPLSDYSGTTSLYTITTTSSEVIDGSKTLKATDDYGKIGNDNVNTPRGDEYRARIKMGDSAAEPALLVCVQNTSYPLDDCYMAHIDGSAGVLRLSLREGGSLTTKKEASLGSLSTGTIYELAVELASDTVKAVLYDSAGDTVLAATNTLSDTTWSGGQLGFYTGGAGGFPAYYDTVTQESLSSGGSSTTIIDDFEDGSLSEYNFDRGSSGASVASSPTKNGSYALEYTDTYIEAISTSGLDAYPSPGDTFRYWVRGTGGAEMTNFTYGVQDHQNRYFVRVNIANDRLKLYRYENGSGNLLNKQTSGFTLSQDAWYEVKIQWASDGTHTVTLYDSSSTQLSKISATDSTWISGGVGYDAYLSSGQSVYFDYVTLGPEAGAKSRHVIDDFTDEDLSEYTIVKGSSAVKTVSDKNYSSGSALQFSDSDSLILSSSGLNHYPMTEDFFHYWFKYHTGGTVCLSYGVQDESNRYEICIDCSNDTLRLYKYENGSKTEVAGGSIYASLKDGHWYRVAVDWRPTGWHIFDLCQNNGDLVFGLNAFVDGAWSDGGVGYGATLKSGERVFVDYVHLGAYSPDCAGAIVDDFYDSDLSEYQFDSTTDSSDVGFTSSYTRHGGNALEIQGVNAGLISRTGLDIYPSSGDVIDCWIRATNGTEKIDLLFGVQDFDNKYYARVDFENGSLALYTDENGSTTLESSSSASSPLMKKTWYRIEIDWNGNTKHVTLYDQNERRVTYVKPNVDKWTDGGIGYNADLGSEGTMHLDGVCVQSQHIPDIKDFTDQYGGVTKVDTEELSDKDGYDRARYTYRFEDGTTKTFDSLKMSQSIRRTTGPDCAYLERAMKCENKMIRNTFDTLGGA